MDERHGPSSTDVQVLTKNHRLATNLHVVNTIIHDNFFEAFLNHNTPMGTDLVLKRQDMVVGYGGHGGKRDQFWREGTEQALDTDGENFAENLFLKGNASIATAVDRGLDLNCFSKPQWSAIKKNAISLFKRYDEASARFSKLRSHEANLFEDGFTTHVDVYYLQSKPDAHRAVTNRLNTGTFYESTGM